MDISKLEFPLDSFANLVKLIGWNSLQEWIDFFKINSKNFSCDSSFNEFQYDWNWGLAYPLLSDAYKLNLSTTERQIIGLSALPGTGKSTLGKWLERSSSSLDFKIAVISLDDFYLKSKDMSQVVSNNPWNVSRGYPGTHDIQLIIDKLFQWKKTGLLNVPVFDKSLRNGLGDRSYWRKDNPDILILEGWFLGVNPILDIYSHNELINPSLNHKEIQYRKKIQNNLKYYSDIWKLIDRLWHLKPLEFKFSNKWKIGQENEMFIKRGYALKDKSLYNFLRMINASIPQRSFDEIKADFLVLINKDRKLLFSGSGIKQ